MNLSSGQMLLLIAAMAAATMLTRFLPFFLFPEGRETPEYVKFLGRTLPYATIALLVVYCFKGVSLTAWPFGLPELLAAVGTVGIHVWKRNTLLSIAAGTGIYMLLVQLVF
ncbi:MAG: AzlD domain-containing protein [bacterium]|nr:AzlD domain-containing protein [bacterium]